VRATIRACFEKVLMGFLCLVFINAGELLSIWTSGKYPALVSFAALLKFKIKIASECEEGRTALWVGLAW
jgi:hypothetical protein